MSVRIGFLGAGFIARHHLGMLRLGRADATVTCVHDPDGERAAAFAAAAGCRVVDGEDAVLADVDAVYVCTWTSEHRQLVEAAARAGVAVFCEKPLATNLPDAVAMARAVDRAGVVNQVGLVLRDYPGLLALRHLVARPRSGRPMAVVFRDDQYLPVQGMYRSQWRADVARAGAGTLLEHSIHDLDILEWLLGTATSVSARSRSFHGLDGIEDVCLAQLEFADGPLATLTSVWHDVLERPSLRRIEVFCERSWVALEGDLFGPVRWVDTDGDRGQAPEEVLEGDALVGMLHAHGIRPRNPDAAFVEAVAAGAAASPGIADALRAHLLVEVAYRSSAEGGTALEVPAGVPGRDWE